MQFENGQNLLIGLTRIRLLAQGSDALLLLIRVVPRLPDTPHIGNEFARSNHCLWMPQRQIARLVDLGLTVIGEPAAGGLDQRPRIPGIGASSNETNRARPLALLSRVNLLASRPGGSC